MPNSWWVEAAIASSRGSLQEMTLSSDRVLDSTQLHSGVGVPPSRSPILMIHRCQNNSTQSGMCMAGPGFGFHLCFS